MRKIINFSYKGIDVPFEIYDTYWMVNLMPISKKFNKKVDDYVFPPHIGAMIIHVHTLSKHPTKRVSVKGVSETSGNWYHYYAASFIAEWLDRDFFFWLLMRYDDIIKKYATTLNLEANEPEQFVLSASAKVDNDMTLREFCKKHDVPLDCKCDFGIICSPTGIHCDYFSIFNLAAENGYSTFELIVKLHRHKIVERVDGKWLLTKEYQRVGLREAIDFMEGIIK